MTEINKELLDNNENIMGSNSSFAAENYWLNEIKSQEDTARQIVSISALLLGLSITMLSSNIDKIKFFAILSQNMSKSYLPENDSGILYITNKIMYYELNFLGFIILILSFFSLLFVWIIVMDNANYALKLERSKSTSYNSPTLEKIANIKHNYVYNTMKIISWGVIGIISLLIIFNILLLRGVPYYTLLPFSLLSLFLWLISIYKIFLYWARVPSYIRRRMQFQFD